MNKSEPYTPSIVLVKTWLDVLRSNVDKEATLHVKHKLVRNFGSVDLAVMYLEQQSEQLSA
ncbi:MAG: hypothetical protein ACI88H_000485 [Cocleimonas sp.]|jgi:hypothetical protein